MEMIGARPVDRADELRYFQVDQDRYRIAGALRGDPRVRQSAEEKHGAGTRTLTKRATSFPVFNAKRRFSRDKKPGLG